MDIGRKIHAVFANVDNPIQRSAYRDLFAAGCYLRKMGHRDAGLKACMTALRAAGCNETRKISEFIPDNEEECFEAAMPHEELQRLFPRHAPLPK